jgi:hypothetical protein
VKTTETGELWDQCLTEITGADLRFRPGLARSCQHPEHKGLHVSDGPYTRAGCAQDPYALAKLLIRRVNRERSGNRGACADNGQAHQTYIRDGMPDRVFGVPVLSTFRV